MANYDIIFGFDCQSGSGNKIDFAFVKTSDGKPGILVDDKVFTKEDLKELNPGE